MTCHKYFIILPVEVVFILFCGIRKILSIDRNLKFLA